MTQPSRALLIGLDSAVPGRWRKYAEAGLLPVGQRLLAEGCFAARCLPALPTLTTTNWATIATGSWPGTHGVTDFNPHRPGDVPDDSPQGFDARAVRAEFIWEAAARAGRDSIVVNWPGSWPPRDAPDGGAGRTTTRPPRAADAQAPGRVIMVGGAGIELNEWRIGLPGKARLVALAAEQRFSTQKEPGAAHVTLPPDGRPFELPFHFRQSYDAVRSGLSIRCRVLPGSKGPVVRFSLPGRAEALAELAEGEWSERLILPFEVNGSATAGAFRLKLQALDPAAGLFRLYVTDICRLAWLEHPSGVLGDTAGFAGLPTPGVGWDSLGSGAIDLDTFVDLTGMATAWLADACARLLREHPCDLFCAHFHAIDSFYHLCSGGLDGRLTPDADERRRFEAAELAVYRQLDAALSTLIAEAGESALIALVSDHGATPPGPAVPLQRILRDAGLLAVEERAALSPDLADPGTPDRIDWTRTLAIPQGSCYVRLNLRGREPHGRVAPDSFEEVRTRVMRAMSEYRDPESGTCPFSLVIRKEEAAALGLYGDSIGDVVFAVRQEFSDEHGQMLPDAIRSEGSWGMPALCLFSGAGAAAGGTLSDGLSLVDVAPTICQALGLPAPLGCDGVAVPGLLAAAADLDTTRIG